MDKPMIIDRRKYQTTETVYMVAVPHNGLIIAEEVVQCFADVPKGAVLCGFSDDLQSVKFSFRHKETVDIRNPSDTAARRE